jgi:hypothetical protein
MSRYRFGEGEYRYMKYGEGDWDALHRDLYGDLVFPSERRAHQEG